MSEPIKFGVYLPTYIPNYRVESSYDSVLGIALEAEKVGLDSVWICDHFYGLHSVTEGRKERTPDIYETWTTLAALASQTKSLSLGTCVVCIPYRNPAVLAKMAANLDVISKGRLILGVGLGWRREEFLGYGIPWEGFNQRLEKTKEGIEIIKALWTKPIVNYYGKQYKLIKAQLWPKPFQKPRPPIWLGTIGSKAMGLLRGLDGWLPSLLPLDDYRELAATAKNFVKKDDKRSIGMGLEFYTGIASTCDLAVDQSRDFIKQWFGITLEEIMQLKGKIKLTKKGTYREMKIGLTIGGPDECIAQVERYIKAGVNHFILHFMPMTATLEGIKLYANKVIPHIRENYE